MDERAGRHKIPWMSTADFKSQIEIDDGAQVFPLAGIIKHGGYLVKSADDKPLTRTWVISTMAIDRDGDTIDPKGWKLTNYRKGGSVLWAHGYDSQPGAGQVPIAKPLKTWVDDDKLVSTAEFTSREINPFGYMVFQLAEGGFVRGASVGFRPIEFQVAEDRDGFMPLNHRKMELLEWSVTPIPSNPEALDQARAFGIDVAPMKSWIEQTKDTHASVPGVTPADLESAYRIVTRSVSVQVPADLKPKDQTPMTKTARKQTEEMLGTLYEEVGTAFLASLKSFDQAIDDVVYAKAHGYQLSQEATDLLKGVDEKLQTVRAATTQEVAPAGETATPAPEPKAVQPEVKEGLEDPVDPEDLEQFFKEQSDLFLLTQNLKATGKVEAFI